MPSVSCGKETGEEAGWRAVDEAESSGKAYPLRVVWKNIILGLKDSAD